MCGISGVELMVILVIAIVVLGPDRLPEMMRLLGKGMREVRKVTSELGGVRDEFTKSIREDLTVPQQTAARRQAAGRDGQDVSEIDALRARQAALDKAAAKASANAQENQVDGASLAASGAVAAGAAAALNATNSEPSFVSRYDEDAYREMLDDMEKLPVQVRPMGRAIATQLAELRSAETAVPVASEAGTSSESSSDLGSDEGGAK